MKQKLKQNTIDTLRDLKTALNDTKVLSRLDTFEFTIALDDAVGLLKDTQAKTKPNKTMSKDKTKTQQTPCCSSCKSTTDLTFDASGYWNMNTQSVEFELVSVYCNHCYNIGDYKLVPANNKTK